MAGRERTVEAPPAIARAKRRKSVIEEYEKRYGVRITEQELDALLEKSFGNPDISPSTRAEVAKGLKEKAKQAKLERKPQKKSG